MASVINNRRILKNTVYLYCRMFFIMALSLYSVRIVLKELGVVDYGIYNVVGSVVALCSFLTGSLTAASNRFFSREILKEDKSFLNKSFCLNITFFGFLILCAIVLLETVGLWYVNCKMIIPYDRLVAANVAYQLSIFTLATSFIAVPYNALIITHEKMSVYAYIGIIEAVTKLIIAWLLIITPIDKLISYALLMAVLSACLTIIPLVYCNKNYTESKYHFYWNKAEFSEIFKFISLYFLGSISVVIRAQGLNILINAFYSPAINASRAIATQVEGASKKFSDGYFTASKPQIYKSYVNGEFEGLNLLINRITMICTFLMMIFVLPISLNADFILSCWLGQVPNKAVIFVVLVLVDSSLNVTCEPIILSILATGKQGLYQLSEFILRCVTLPVSYIFLLLGSEPEITIIVCIFFSVLSVMDRIYFLKRSMKQFRLISYFGTLLRILLAIAIVLILICLLDSFTMSGLCYLLSSTTLSVGLIALTFYFIVLPKRDKLLVNNMAKKFFLKTKTNRK